ncbi:unnamed protein product [Amoebophrya sp. A120]|nr:unnamed protein product [Amoebophrya sp. A120]|eukprot:GSA120T00000013001.1
MKKFAKIGAAGSGLLPLAGEQMFAAAVQKAGKATHEWAGSESSAKGFMEVDRVRVDSSKGKKRARQRRKVRPLVVSPRPKMAPEVDRILTRMSAPRRLLWVVTNLRTPKTSMPNRSKL